MATKANQPDVRAIARAAVERQMTKETWDHGNAATLVSGDGNRPIGYLMHTPFAQKGKRVFPEGCVFLTKTYRGDRVVPASDASDREKALIEALNAECYKGAVKKDREVLSF